MHEREDHHDATPHPNSVVFLDRMKDGSIIDGSVKHLLFFELYDGIMFQILGDNKKRAKRLCIACM